MGRIKSEEDFMKIKKYVLLSKIALLLVVIGFFQPVVLVYNAALKHRLGLVVWLIFILAFLSILLTVLAIFKAQRENEEVKEKEALNWILSIIGIVLIFRAVFILEPYRFMLRSGAYFYRRVLGSGAYFIVIGYGLSLVCLILDKAARSPKITLFEKQQRGSVQEELSPGNQRESVQKEVSPDNQRGSVQKESAPSYFDGGLAQLIGWSILGFLITVVTLGICYPWSFTMLYSWETKHTVIEGKRLKFDGTAAQLFGNWIKWFLLIIVTLGIYGFWIPIKLKKWKTKHTSFEQNSYPRQEAEPANQEPESASQEAEPTGPVWICRHCGKTNPVGTMLCKYCGN
jgi:Bacterial protein of unknown function (DUF898).